MNTPSFRNRLDTLTSDLREAVGEQRHKTGLLQGTHRFYSKCELFKGATSLFCILKKLARPFKIVISIYFSLRPPQAYLFLFALELPLWCFSSFANHYI